MKKREKRVAYILRAGMTVLTIILIILFFGIMSLVSDLQGTARVVNYAGLVRGETQRVIKLEMSKEPDDEMIETVEAIINGLRFGSDELDLVRLEDTEFADIGSGNGLLLDGDCGDHDRGCVAGSGVWSDF